MKTAQQTFHRRITYVAAVVMIMPNFAKYQGKIDLPYEYQIILFFYTQRKYVDKGYILCLCSMQGFMMFIGYGNIDVYEFFDVSGYLMCQYYLALNKFKI